jgi:hypothetical protein
VGGKSTVMSDITDGGAGFFESEINPRFLLGAPMFKPRLYDFVMGDHELIDCAFVLGFV